MKKKAIIGAGGFAREIKSYLGIDDIKMFVDDFYWKKNNQNILPISEFDFNSYTVVVAIGNPTERKKMVDSLPKNTEYFTFIHPTSIITGSDVIIGKGTIICPNTILTTNINLGEHCHLNLSTTIGHDCVIGNYFTTAPGAKISGNCTIGDLVYLGTNTSIREKIKITNNVTLGLNSGVVKDINESGVYGGTPTKKIK